MRSRPYNTPVSIIVAVDQYGGFCKDGKMPWNIPEDMERFRKITTNNICIMGRRTYEDMLDMWKLRQQSSRKSKKKKRLVKSEPKQILPNRESFVITSNTNFHCPGARTSSSITEAIQQHPSSDSREIFILGGYRMFIEALPRANKVYMTIVKSGDYKCDNAFPVDYLDRFYKIVEGSETKDCYFVTYNRK